MRQLQKWLGKHKTKLVILTMLMVLSIPLALTACGSAESEDTERPKTPFELESMIQSSDANIEDMQGELATIKAAVASLQSQAQRDFSSDIANIVTRLNAIEAKLSSSPLPTPTATNPGGWAYPTPTATATQQTGTGIHATLLQDSIRDGDKYDFDVSILASTTTLSKYVVLELMPITTNKPDIASASFLWSGTESFDVTVSPGLNDCQLVRIVSKSKVLVPQGATYTYTAIYDFDYQPSVVPVSWTYNWYLTDTP